MDKPAPCPRGHKAFPVVVTRPFGFSDGFTMRCRPDCPWSWYDTGSDEFFATSAAAVLAWNSGRQDVRELLRKVQDGVTAAWRHRHDVQVDRARKAEKELAELIRVIDRESGI